MTTTINRRHGFVAVFAAMTVLSCTEPQRAKAPEPEVKRATQGLTTRYSENFESGLGAWTLTASTGSAWLGINPSTVSVSSALNPSLVTLADTGAHLPAIGGGSQVAWFGSTSTGTFIGSNYVPGSQNPKGGGSSATVQLGTMSSPSIVLPVGEVAQLEFDSWWEIEGVAAASYDKMDVLVSTNGGTSYTQLGRLNPNFAAPQPDDAAYSSGGPAQSPVWRRYVYSLTSYAGQTIKLQFKFDSGDTAYNAFRGLTVDNISVGTGATLPAPIISAVTPSVATANALVVIDGANYLQGAQFFIGATQITAANITQFGASSLIFRVPSLTAGTYDVRVRNPDAQEFTLPSSFTYVTTAAPGVTSIAPATGSAGVSQAVTITGTNFVSGAQVIIGGAAASSVTVVSATQITASAPGLVAGTHNVVVRNPSGQEGVKYAAYTITGAPPLTLTAPNGGESWVAGSSQTITWSSSAISNVDIELYKSGVLHSTIASGIASSGSYTWALPGGLTPAADYRVRIVATSGSANDTSNANFTVAAPAGSIITVTPTTNGTISCNSPVAVGGTLTCTITPSSGYFLSTLTDNGVTVLGSVTSGQYIVANVTAAKTITGTFSSAAPVISSPSTGLVTSDPTPTFSGSCVSGATVSVHQGATTLCSSACVASEFSCTAAAQPEGVMTISASQADASGNSGSASASIIITIDTLAPAAPSITAPTSGAILGSATPVISGACETGATVNVLEGATLRCTASCIGSAFSCTSTSISDGAHTFVAHQVDLAANVSVDASVSFNVDTSAPLAPALTSPLAGASLPTATPSIQGTCETGASVTVVEGLDTRCTATCTLGTFACTSSVLAEGPHSLVAHQTDAAGNQSSSSSSLAFITDTLSPSAPTISAPAMNAVLSNTQPTLSGACESGASIQVRLGATVVCTSVCTAGSYTCQVSTLSEGPHTLGVSQVDAAGNTSSTTSLTITVDTLVPAAPSITAPTSGALLATATPVISGACETGATVNVLEGATLRCTASCLSSAFSCTSTSISDGAHTFVAHQVDLAANVSVDASVSFNVDTSPPSAPALTSPLAGASLPTTTPSIQGTCETGASVTVVEGLDTRCTATCTLGTFACTSSVLAEGPHSLVAHQTDAAGNQSSSSSSLAFITDTLSPSAPIISAPAMNAVLSNTQPTLSGACESGASIQVQLGATVVCTSVCTAGSYTCQVSTLSEGPHTLEVSQVDAAGNTSVTTSLTITVDTLVPAAPVITTPASGALLASATPLMSGTCETGATVSVLEGATVLCSSVCSGGAFSCATSTLTDGAHDVFARQADAAGNVSVSSDSSQFVVDTQVAVATLSQPMAGAALSTLTPAFSGTCESGATVTVSSGAQVLCTATCVSASFTCISAPLPEGAHSVSVQQVDQAGNTSTGSSPVAFSLDVTAPTPPQIVTPAEAANVATATPLFSGNCETGTTVSVFEGAAPLCSASCVAGEFSCVSTVLNDGAHLILAQQTDAAGNSSTNHSVSFNTDTSAPLSAVVSAPVAGAALSTATPRLAGSCESGAQVELREDLETLCSATCVDGAFECTSSFRIDGPHSVIAVQTDVAGNVGSPSTRVDFSIDTHAPDAPVIQAPAAGVTLSNEQPTVSGSCETGSTVEVRRGPGMVCQATCVASTFACVVSALGEGSISLSVRQHDSAGNQSPFASIDFIVDLTAPAGPTLTSPLEGSFVATTTPTFAGSCESGARVDVFEGATLLCTATCASELFSCESLSRAQGVHEVFARQTDSGGNAGVASAPRSFTVDTLVDPATFSLPAEGATLSTLAPTISGACETDATVTVSSGATTACTATCIAATFSCVSVPLPEGPITLVLTQVDRAGNASASSQRSLTLDSSVPAAPSVLAPAAGAFLASTTLTIQGSCEDGAVVEVFSGETSLCTAVCTNQAYTCTSAQQPEGLALITAKQSDAAGNLSNASPAHEVTLDVTNPALVVLSSPLEGSATGDNTPTLTGDCEPFAAIEVRVASQMHCEATCSDSGHFSCTSTVLADGARVFEVTQRDRAGNESAPSTRTITVDTTRPAIGAIAQPVAGALVPTSQSVVSGTGEPLGTAIVFANGIEVCRATIGAGGEWSCPVTLSEGAQALQVVVRDPQGNESSRTPAVTVHVDVTPPSAPSLLLPSAGQVVGLWPSFSGRGEPASMVRVEVDGAEVCQARVNQDGAWSCLVTAALAPGMKVASASAIDAAGHTSVESEEVSFEARAIEMPATPVLTAPASGDVVATSLPRFTGRAEPGSQVRVQGSSGELCTVVASSEGTFECTSTVTLPDGEYHVTTSASRESLTSAASQPTRFTIDTRPLGPPVILSPVAGATVGSRPLFSGTAPPSSIVAVSVDDVVACSATTDAQGAFACLPSASLVVGEHVALAVATSGQSSTNSATVGFAVQETAAPTAPVIIAPLAGALVPSGSVAFIGLAEPGSRVQVREGEVVLCEAEVTAAGDWACTADVMSDGLHQVSAFASTSSGVSLASPLLSLTIDRVGSPAPTLVSPSEGQTTNAWPRFVGTANAKDRVVVRVDAREVCGAASDTLGAFSCTVLAPLASGAHQAQVVSFDAAGRASAPSSTVQFTVSTREPRVLAPVAGAVLSTHRPQLTGIVEPGSAVEAFIDGRSVCISSALVDGMFSCVPTADEVDGPKVVKIVADDGFGTKRASAEVHFVLDTLAPAQPSLSAPALDELVLGGVAQFSGTGEPGSTVTVLVNGQRACTALVSATGAWSCEATGLVDGQQTVSLSAVDVAGNQSGSTTSAFSADVEFAPPTLVAPAAGAKVLGPTVEFSGSGVAKTLVSVVDKNGALLCTAIVAADGTFSCAAELSSGPRAVTVHSEWMSARSVDSDVREFTVMRQANFSGGGAGCSTSGVSSGGLALLMLVFALRRKSAN